ncbi:MAG TPA: tetratricopeptide repeat-containing protein [Pyrinomonadaceae bacterium]|nr:tetratricopeptide repeat-containing protein [Pyrinomonadaceae bacterium]
MNNLDLELQQLDEKRQMRNLANAIKFADSFSLLFVRCNQRSRQKEIIEELKAQLAEYKIKVILLENQIEHLLDELQQKLADEKPDAILVYGLESSFPKADEAAESKFVVTLNHSRNSFKKVLSCPLVLFLPEYALSAIYHGATDFYSIRSGVYLFSAKAEETEQLIVAHSSPGYLELSSLLFEERQNRIRTIEELLAEYQSLPDSQRDAEKEFRLKEKLADLYRISGEFDKATKLYEENVAYARKIKDLVLLPYSVDRLATSYQAQKRHDEAMELLNEALEIYESTVGSTHPEYATILNNLGTAYETLGRYDKAIELFNKTLKIYEETIGTKHPEYATSINNLAAVYHSQGKYDEAIRLYEKAIEISKEVINTDHPNHAHWLANLSRIYYEQQNYQKALALAKKAYEIRHKILGVNHPQTKDIKKGIEMNQAKIKEKASQLVPYKK